LWENLNFWIFTHNADYYGIPLLSFIFHLISFDEKHIRIPTDNGGLYAVQKGKKRREAEKESKAVRHNQAECRQYLTAVEADGTGKGSTTTKFFQQTLTNLRNIH
jgi:hypothetical protein